LSKKSTIPKYLKELLIKHPNIASGRKNFDQHHNKLIRTIELIKKYIKINS
tara:strand:- start:542 stop:694 length:153 start_codon:yes stop_codon:yes gene_type:complete